MRLNLTSVIICDIMGLAVKNKIIKNKGGYRGKSKNCGQKRQSFNEG